MKSFQHRSRGGVLLVALLLVLVFFGVLAGMQTLLVVQASLSTRALAVGHVREEYRHRTKLALREAAQAALEAGEPASFAARAGALLGELGCAAGAVEFMEMPTLQAARNRLPMLEVIPPRLAEAGAEMPVDMAFLGLSTHQKVEGFEATQCRVRFHGLSAMGSQEDSLWELRCVGVPLGSQAFCLYELPSEIGQVANLESALGAGLGFKSRNTLLGSMDLKAAEALPYHFRPRVSLAQAYSALFSNGTLTRLLAAAGPEGFVSLQQGQTVGGAGCLEKQGSKVTMNLSASGIPRVQVVAAQDAALELQLKEEVPGANMEPLVLLVVGQSASPLRVRLGRSVRPVIFVGIHVILTTEEAVAWAGGVLLAPGSRVEESVRGLHVSHFSCHLASAPVAGAVLADLPPSEELLPLYPRTYYAGVRELWP